MWLTMFSATFSLFIINLKTAAAKVIVCETADSHTADGHTADG